MRSLTSVRFAILGAVQIGALAMSSCGAGTAGIVGSSGGSSSSTTVQPAIAAFTVERPKEPAQAKLRFTLSTDARVQLLYQLPGDVQQSMTQVGANPRVFPAGTNTIPWNFALEPGLDASFHAGVLVFAIIPGAQELPAEGANALTLGLGNDAPVVEQALEPTSPEVAGIIAVRLRVSDSSRDQVSIRAEFDVLGDVPDQGYQLARPGGLLLGEPTPPFAFAGVVAPESGASGLELDFFWNTDVDLRDLERDARLRFTAVDPIVEGQPVETGPIHVDNNAAPIVQFDSGALLTNPDDRRGIPIPFRVFDEEEDLVEVIFQWRREGEVFPSLDTDGDGLTSNAEIDAIQADPELSAERRIAAAFPYFARGLVVPVDATTVRLPELARGESWILAAGLEGRTLEILRSSSIPAAPAWSTNPLVQPIAALPLGDGLTALVLDAPGSGRLREIELATGDIVPRNGGSVIASLPPTPTAMALERGGKAVLIASDFAGIWRIDRVELATGAVTELIVSDGSQPGPVRGIASLGTKAAVFTAGSVLFHVDYRDALAPELGTLLSGLAAPWGVVVDPLPPNRIYLSERDANRVLAVELDSHGKLPVVVKTANMQVATIEAPEALALERNGARLLVVASAPGGGRRLVGLDLGALGGNVFFPIGATTTADISSVSTGPEGSRLLCLPALDELRVAGGIEQRRVIAAHSSSSQDVAVEAAFDPLPTPGLRWRIPEESHRLRASAQGVTGRFVWDSADALGGSVFLRAIGRDEEIGLVADGSAPKAVRSPLDSEPLFVGGFPATFLYQGAAADLDGDGDQDLVSANSVGSNLTVFFQLSPGSFAAAPSLVVGGFGKTDSPVSVAAADLDGDGDQDLVSANGSAFGVGTGNNLTVFFQLSAGNFAAAPLVLGGFAPLNGPVSVAAADLDGDGDQDLVSANGNGNNLTVFFQLSAGNFAAVPLVLGSSSTTLGPSSVAAADLDGDGDQDLVSANFDADNLTVFFQLSAGSFAAAPLVLGSSSTTLGPISVAAADLDGDGDQDLVSANVGGNDLTVFLQLSPGSFASAPLVLGSSATTTNPVSVGAADLDGDGDQDLVSANVGGNDLTVFLQLSPGSFAAAPLVLGSSATTTNPSLVGAADLDGDGDQDLVSNNSSNGNLTVFFQLSAGSFAVAPLVLGGLGTLNDPVSVGAADLDGDGDQDLVSANVGSNDLTVFFQLSPGSFAAAPLVLGGFAPLNGPVSVAAADLDGDGDQDLVSANENGNNLTVFFQLSAGNFAAVPLVLGSSSTTLRPSSVAAADLDGDGDQDLVSANLDGDNLTVFFQLSPGSFAVAPLVLGDIATTRRPFSVAAADLDGDGDQDLVSANSNGHNLTVFLQLSPGSFAAAPLVLGSSSTTLSPFSVAAADLDGDGDQDLVSANKDGDNLTVFFQLSPGSFAAVPLVLGSSSTTLGPVSVGAADLDGDGDQDLVSANRLGGNLTVFLQLSPGRFAAVPLVLGSSSTTLDPVSVGSADLDGDGDQDVVSANNFGFNLTIFLGGR